MQLPFSFPSPLRTERLVLRFMTVSDIDDVHAYQSREDVCRYMTYEPRDRPTVAEKVTQYADAHVLAGDGDYWQIAATLDGRVIGDVYFTIKSVEQQTAEIGWSLHPDFQGRGYMSEAAGAMLALAFDQVGLRRIIAVLDPRNDGSTALCRRLGLREEAHFVEDEWFKGEWADTGIYAILAREWASRG
ncbi:GNAT family N-acetyltransferase [Solirubrobacter phytolaccae]|uniref:GNAT family N-acetyltransferase n=1 Tax=Solirubrobacter phytolaccae TaxID=1404360 RepID=A0A9X3SGF5_9ACTN|nr:GNAT family protein [Solirubrobacter phytolaccae]MDA0182402.1 GNAT family N-acetyltransferase [Solirubrobacter phytolaccae]